MLDEAKLVCARGVPSDAREEAATKLEDSDGADATRSERPIDVAEGKPCGA